MPFLDKQSFGRIARGGAKERFRGGSQKEGMADTSPFHGRSSFSTKEFRRWTRGSKSWGAMGSTHLSKQEREKLGQRLSDPKLVGKFFEKGKRESQRLGIELAKGKWGKFGALNRKERKSTGKLYKGFFGK